MSRAAIGPKPEPEDGPLAPTPWTVDMSSTRVVIRDANGAQVLTVNGTNLTRFQDIDVASALRDLINASKAPAADEVQYLVDSSGDYWFELDGPNGFILSDASRAETITEKYQAANLRRVRGSYSACSRSDVARTWTIVNEGLYEVE